jgi:Domain of unknown function (DUF4397)
MKRNLSKEKLSIAAAFVLFVASFASCKKNDINPDGYMNLKVVNAAPNSGPQSFTLANQVLISGGLDFANGSDYINTHSGTNLIAQFTSVGTNAVYATGSLWTGDNQSWTVYVAGSGSSVRVKSYQDDLSTPPSGMVKIKFIHLSDAAPSDISVKDSTGSNIFSSVVIKDVATGYKNINPGNFSLKIYDIVSGNDIGDFSVTGLLAGKIYTLYLTGSSSSTLSVQTVQHN